MSQRSTPASTTKIVSSNFILSFFKIGRSKKSPFFFKFSVAFFLYNRITDINTLILNYG